MRKKYKLTGINNDGKRIKIESNNFTYVNCINIYKGNLWEFVDGKWQIIKKINNWGGKNGAFYIYYNYNIF